MQSNSLVTSVEVENEINKTLSINDAEHLVKESVVNQKEKFAKKIEINKSIIAYLSKKFPNCFALEGEIKPLKLGIFQDIIEDEAVAAEFSKTNLRAALRYYTMSWKYLAAVKEGVNRVNLLGEASGIVDEKQSEHAKNQLEEAKSKVKARQDANRKTSRNKTAHPKRDAAKGQFKQSSKPNSKSKSHSPKIKAVQNQATEANNPEKVLNTNKGNSSKVLSINEIKIGKLVNVLIGQSYAKAEVVEITKDNVRVTLPTGITLTVKHEHLTE
ncbi:RNA chaperone ProQ [Thorsellia anophelis]|uniref:RNA chaperone ProQ n=1 Tax=Thorsellia anophelis DSM 18579 TaxID=1123402 RepID=A0A1I0C8U7_9GAMM|nr:RNA chaperone ProQ [Thorsellia anophelis]SET15364.1 ProP effector [Thorsellia anophelis DSM 18579]